MQFYIGVTDTDWYQFLKNHPMDDINFWQPGGNHVFGAIPTGAPFLFKLKKKQGNKIVGLGFYSASAVQTIDAAWDFFGLGNGCPNFHDFRKKISKYKFGNVPIPAAPISIGCIILTDPVFFAEEDWLSPPVDWSINIVQGKRYDDSTTIGTELWTQIQQVLVKYRFFDREVEPVSEFVAAENEPRYYNTLSRVRIGQGSFRYMVANAYGRACAITGDHTGPVLEAAHIKPYADSGPHRISNGLLLRSDLHKLFDSGYLTVTPDLHIEVSNRIREEFNNGKLYYDLHGHELLFTPKRKEDKPDRDYLDWHNNNVFKAG